MADLLSQAVNSFNHDLFPVGLRVLLVDDDPSVLKIFDQVSAQCHYHVTTCDDAYVALNFLREKRDSFDVVIISDVHMPNLEFLHHLDQEFNVPLVLMCVDGSSSSVMEGYRHRACHYLTKPIHEDDIRIIWQHAVRNKTHNKEYSTCSVIDATQGRKRRLSRGEGDHHPMPAAKKPRFKWTKECHQQFLDAVGQLGNDKVVPKKILQLMNIPGLTRANVASHLQKYRLQTKKKSKASKAHQEQNGILNGTLQPNNGLGMQALANADAIRHYVSPQAQSENHYCHSSNESSQQAAYGDTYTTAPLTYDPNNNYIPYLYNHNGEQHHQQQMMMMQQYHPIHQILPYNEEHDFISDSFIYDNVQPISYIMAPPSHQSQPYAGINPASDVSYNNNNTYSFVGGTCSVLDQNTFSPQILNNNNYSSSSSLGNIAELHG